MNRIFGDSKLFDVLEQANELIMANGFVRSAGELVKFLGVHGKVPSNLCVSDYNVSRFGYVIRIKQQCKQLVRRAQLVVVFQKFHESIIST